MLLHTDFGLQGCFMVISPTQSLALAGLSLPVGGNSWPASFRPLPTGCGGSPPPASRCSLACSCIVTVAVAVAVGLDVAVAFAVAVAVADNAVAVQRSSSRRHHL
jgi:hypothetical protein